METHADVFTWNDSAAGARLRLLANIKTLFSLSDPLCMFTRRHICTPLQFFINLFVLLVQASLHNNLEGRGACCQKL